MNVTRLVFLGLISSLVSCTSIPIKLAKPIDLLGREYLYKVSRWSLDGRLAVTTENQSLSGSIIWTHRDELEKIELAGPFGQGRTIVEIFDGVLKVENGEETHVHFGNINELMKTHFKIPIPISALKFWVLGLTQPNVEYTRHDNGFVQAEWNIEFQQMIQQGQRVMPRKITMQKNSSKMKLVINNWVFD